MANTGPFDARPSCGSVTTTAISMMRSRLGTEPGHLEVEPDQVLVVVRGSRVRSSVAVHGWHSWQQSSPIGRSLHCAPMQLPLPGPLVFAARAASRRWLLQVLARHAPGAPRRRATATRCRPPFAATVDARRAPARPPTTRSPRPASACWQMAFGAAVLLGWTLLGGLDALNAALRDAVAPRCGHAGLPARAARRLRADRRRCSTCRSTLYATFRLEQRFGFNKMTWRLWLADAAKGAARRRRRSACRSPR